VIRYAVSEAEVRSAITELDKKWFINAAAVIAKLPSPPESSDFKPLWSKIKGVYIELQNSKCCFCEKPLEGKIEQDVEHFRPKAEVKPWNVPSILLAAGIAIQQRADGSSEPGYSQLAYSPFNYAMSCKTCNSTLKKNFFPIEGTRDTGATDPFQIEGERALLIYPLGALDRDPEELIEFEALSPVPKSSSGFDRRRALVTIELFRLDDSSGRKPLFKERAALVRLLFLELEGRAGAKTTHRRRIHEQAIDTLTSVHAPFTNCLRSFERLYDTDQARAEEIADACAKLLGTKS
jgi:hypothetical protein